MKNNIADQEVYDIAVKIAKKEFHQNPNIYRCEVLDLAGDLFKFYQHYTKPHIDKAEDPKGFAVKGLYFALSSIREFAFSESKRIVIESDLFDGEFQPNTYFKMLEENGGYHLWNDNEKVVNKDEVFQRTSERDCFYQKIDNPVSQVTNREFWDKLESLLSERDYMIVLAVIVDGKTEREVAEKVGLSHQAVHKVIQKLSKFKNDFKEYM